MIKSKRAWLQSKFGRGRQYFEEGEELGTYEKEHCKQATEMKGNLKKNWLTVSKSWLFKKLGFTFTCARYKLSHLLQGISLRCHKMRT